MRSPTKRAKALDALERITDFLKSIGFRCLEGATGDRFLPGVRIEAGMALRYERQLVAPGDLLHEAGHLAILPEPFRSVAYGDVESSVSPLVDAWMAGNPHFLMPDATGRPVENPVTRALIQAGELEAQAWSYAAAVAIGVDPKWVFHKNSFQGEAKEVLFALSMSAHAGINGLSAAGMCSRREYPRVRKWLQDASIGALAG